MFVTGTDTGVGKTVVSALLTVEAGWAGKTGVRVGYLKPVQTGVVSPGRPVGTGDGTDAEFVRVVCTAAGVDVEVEVVYELEEALAPAVAAERAGLDLALEPIRESFERLCGSCDAVVVEGAGGLLVPFSGDILMSDIAHALELPLIVVGRPGLGALNHSRLTVEAAKTRGIETAGLVVSGCPTSPGLAERTNLERLAGFAGAPLLGIVPFVPGLETESPSTEAVAALVAARR